MYTSNKTLLQILVEELPKRGGWPEGTTRISQGAVTGCIYADGHRGLFRHNVYGGDDCVTRDQYEAALAASKELLPYQVSTGHYTSDAEAGKTASTADADGWIEWAGGECPVDSDAIVEVKYRKPIPLHINNDRAEYFAWSHDGNSGDIIAYRLVQQHEVKTAGIDVQRDAVKSNDAQLEADMNECEARDEILYELANFAATTKTSLDICVATEIAIWLSGKGYRKQ